LGLLRRSTSRDERRRIAFERLGMSFRKNIDLLDMKRSVSMNLMTFEREARKGKKVKEQIDILKAARRLFEV
jgi:hypothetical protein